MENDQKATMAQAAKDYVPPQTRNISELDAVPINVPIESRKGTDKEGNAFTTYVINVDGEEYRVPRTVLKQIQTLLDKKPELTHVSVHKSGEGLGTEYQVIPQ